VEAVVEGLGTYQLERGEGGYFTVIAPDVGPGALYRFRLDGGGTYPDPASRFQPRGVHQPSQVIDPDAFGWTDGDWNGISCEGQVIYELHVGAFTPEGTWKAAEAKLRHLADLGITAIEVMPVSEFPGRFGWGYDGVHPYAPTRLYGTPDDFRAFVNSAHDVRLGVILDVVYNHLGPEGNYFSEFSPGYFTRRYETDWGDALNFDGEDSGPVRDFFAGNAAYWIDEFHLDGLRLDATQNIYDSSEGEHILALIARRAREAAGKRSILLIGENEPQQVKLIRPLGEGGYSLDMLWNDDLHHSAMVAMTGKNEAYYTDYFGTPQEFVSAVKRGYLYQGQWYEWQGKRRGTSTAGMPPYAFISFIQNHDQVANSLRGLRCPQLTTPGLLRAVTALTLLGPGTPMLFMGQEFGASAPFLFFADLPPELAPVVRAGRQDFLEQWESSRSAEARQCFIDPSAVETFERCILDWSEPERHGEIYALHRHLLHLRRSDSVFRSPAAGSVDGAVLGAQSFVLRWFGGEGNDRMMLVNLGVDLRLRIVPEPLLAPPDGRHWEMLWSSEDPRYGGCGTPKLENCGWRLPGHAAVVMTARDGPPDEPELESCGRGGKQG
jgi:maltooligosyltrehalose trehalohydrolase